MSNEPNLKKFVIEASPEHVITLWAPVSLACGIFSAELQANQTGDSLDRLVHCIHTPRRLVNSRHD